METLSFAVPDIEALDVMLSSNKYAGAGQTSRYMSKRGRHRKSSIVKEIGVKHGRRLLSFSLIGFGVFVAGLAVQILLVQTFGTPKVTEHMQSNWSCQFRLIFWLTIAEPGVTETRRSGDHAGDITLSVLRALF